METLVSTETLRSIDSASIHEYSIPPLILMEHAGVKGFSALLTHLKNTSPPHLNQRIVFVAGGGNNGGDTLVMAREAYLRGMKEISIVRTGTHISTSCNSHITICQSLGIPMHEVSIVNNQIDEKSQQIISQGDIIIEGIMGTGLRGKLNEQVATLVSYIHTLHTKGTYVVSVDIPSGCSDTIPATQTHIHCDLCITFGLQKSAAYHPMSRSSWGKIIRVNPSFPLPLLENAKKSAQLATIDDVVLKRMESSDYKNKRGHLALFAGSPLYTGAPKITSSSAFHSGVGLVTLYCDEEVAPVIKSETASLIVTSVPKEVVIQKESLIDRYDAIAVGSGWQLSHRKEQMLSLLHSRLPMVCDADAIALFASLVTEKKIALADHGPLIFTPHPGELVNMLEILGMPILAQEVHIMGTSESFIDSLIKISRALHAVLVYKSHVVWIVDGTDSTFIPIVVDGSNNALGVAGSGDALTGIIASFLSRGYSPIQSALNGVLIHQRAGVLARESSRWFDVELLITHIGLAYKEREEKV